MFKMERETTTADQVGFCGTACGWQPDQSFVCAECLRSVCYCQGCADDLGDLCDDCACKHPSRAEERCGIWRLLGLYWLLKRWARADREAASALELELVATRSVQEARRG